MQSFEGHFGELLKTLGGPTWNGTSEHSGAATQVHSALAKLVTATVLQQQKRGGSSSSGSDDDGLVNSRECSGLDAGCVEARGSNGSAEGVDNTDSGTATGFQCDMAPPCAKRDCSGTKVGLF